MQGTTRKQGIGSAYNVKSADIRSLFMGVTELLVKQSLSVPTFGWGGGGMRLVA